MGVSRPASAVAAANTPTSSVTCAAAGAPSASNRRIHAHSIASGVSKRPGRRRRSRLRMTTSRYAAIATREPTVAQAAPVTPSAGAPSLPKIKTQLKRMLARFAITSATISLALRDPTELQLQREAQRLAALLETARAESRASGLSVRWIPKGLKTGDDFRFEGLPRTIQLPTRWLGEPVAVHAVQRIVHEPVFLPRWPDAERRSRLVFITRGITREAIEPTLAVLGFTLVSAASSGIDPEAYARFVAASSRFAERTRITRA